MTKSLLEEKKMIHICELKIEIKKEMAINGCLKPKYKIRIKQGAYIYKYPFERDINK